MHSFSCSRVCKAQCLGVQHLSRTEGKAVLYILFVFLCAQSFQHFHAAIFLVGEQRMSDAFHVYAYLVRASGLQTAFDECHIGISLQHAPMCDGFFGAGVLLEIHMR